MAALDVDGDGFVNPTGQVQGTDGYEFTKYLTRYDEREFEGVIWENTYLSPRIGVSWDPWSDGGTRLFAHWGRYYDRLRTDVLIGEYRPDAFSFVFVPNAQGFILPGAVSRAGSLPAINQVDRDLEAPHTDELIAGFERALGPEWSTGVTFIHRDAEDLLQDTDLNHFTCPQADTVMGIDPLAVCGSGGMLDLDRFGDVAVSFPGGTVQLPNGIEDLYAAHPGFNQVLRVDNVNESEYTAWEFSVAKRLHRNWQMRASYLYSRAEGDAERAFSILGNDPSTLPAEEGYLDYDRRHEFKLQAAASLPRGVILGTAVRWYSGLPWSVIDMEVDLDNEDNSLVRVLYPTGRRNDQRNESIFQIDARIEKIFHPGGRVTAGGFLSVVNLLDSDDLVIAGNSSGGQSLSAVRDFGRRFEMGMNLTF